MRGAVCFVVLAIVAVGLHALDGVSAQGQAVEPTKVLAEAREALGGEGRITAVRTFVANGRTRQVRGDNLVPIEFEIQVELPDKYSRRDEFPAQDAGPATTGFSGDRLIQIPAPVAPPAAGGAPAPNPAQQEAALRARVMTAKQDFTRLMLGMFASSFDGFPLTFKYIGQAEAPQGQAHVLDAAGPGNFTARVFISTGTHLPLMVSWQQAAPPAPRRGGPPPSAPNAAPGGAPPQPPAPVENRLYFSDYREVDGLKLPFRLRRAVGGETIEETTFDRFRINARVDPRRFATH